MPLTVLGKSVALRYGAGRLVAHTPQALGFNVIILQLCVWPFSLPGVIIHREHCVSLVAVLGLFLWRN